MSHYWCSDLAFGSLRGKAHTRETLFFSAQVSTCWQINLPLITKDQSSLKRQTGSAQTQSFTGAALFKVRADRPSCSISAFSCFVFFFPLVAGKHLSAALESIFKHLCERLKDETEWEKGRSTRGREDKRGFLVQKCRAVCEKRGGKEFETFSGLDVGWGQRLRRLGESEGMSVSKEEENSRKKMKRR